MCYDNDIETPLKMAKNQFCIPNCIEKMSFHLILLVKLAIWVQKCEEIDKNYQKSHFFQIFAHFSHFGQFIDPHSS